MQSDRSENTGSGAAEQITPAEASPPKPPRSSGEDTDGGGEFHSAQKDNDELAAAPPAKEKKKTAQAAQAMLGEAAHADDAARTRKALDAGADPKAPVYRLGGLMGGKCTAAYLAARSGSKALGVLLDAPGVDPNEGQHRAKIPASRQEAQETGRRLWDPRAKKGKPAVFENTSTPCHSACWKNQPGAIELLMKHGADPNRVERGATGIGNALTPCMIAAKYGSTACLRALAEGAAQQVLENPKMASGLNVNAVAMLYSGKRAPVTALDIAMQHNHEEAVAFLRELGALRAADVPAEAEKLRGKIASFLTTHAPNMDNLADKAAKAALKYAGRDEVIFGKLHKLFHQSVVEKEFAASSDKDHVSVLPIALRTHIVGLLHPHDMCHAEITCKALADAQFVGADESKVPLAKFIVDTSFTAVFFPNGLKFDTPTEARQVYARLIDFRSHKACADGEIAMTDGHGFESLRKKGGLHCHLEPLREIQGHRLQDGIRLPEETRGKIKPEHELCLICRKSDVKVDINIERDETATDKKQRKTVTGNVSCETCGFFADIASHCDACNRCWIKIPFKFFSWGGERCHYHVVNGTEIVRMDESVDPDHIPDSAGLPPAKLKEFHMITRHGGGTNGGGTNMNMGAVYGPTMPIKCAWDGCTALDAITICFDCPNVEGIAYVNSSDQFYFECRETDDRFLQPPHFFNDRLGVRYCKQYDMCNKVFCKKHPMHVCISQIGSMNECDDCFYNVGHTPNAPPGLLSDDPEGPDHEYEPDTFTYNAPGFGQAAMQDPEFLMHMFQTMPPEMRADIEAQLGVSMELMPPDMIQSMMAAIIQSSPGLAGMHG